MDITQKIAEQMASFQEVANKLQKDLATEGENTKVTFETITEKDSDGKPTGKIFVAYLKEPNILAIIRAADMAFNQRMIEAGNFLWPIIFEPLANHSSPEFVTEQGMRIGLCLKIGMQLPLTSVDAKKK